MIIKVRKTMFFHCYSLRLQFINENNILFLNIISDLYNKSIFIYFNNNIIYHKHSLLYTSGTKKNELIANVTNPFRIILFREGTTAKIDNPATTANLVVKEYFMKCSCFISIIYYYTC